MPEERPAPTGSAPERPGFIFVTVGTAGKGIEFVRLIEAMDRIAATVDCEVFIQRGTVDFEPQHARHVRFVRFDEALRLFRDCRFVVGHCGAGTVICALRYHKPMIIVPRRKAAGELDTDDHQLQLAAAIEKSPGIRVVYDVADLDAAVRDYLASPQPEPQPSAEQQNLARAVEEFLAQPKA
jgi:UDP-N-acetylglucosamine transferase subunit ALG13